MHDLAMEQKAERKTGRQMRTTTPAASRKQAVCYLGGLLVAILLAGAAVAGLMPTGQAIRRIDATDLAQLVKGVNPPVILDTRPPAQYRAGHIAGAISFTESEIAERAAALPRYRLLVAYCG